jgi:HAMP domain-containing protein
MMGLRTKFNLVLMLVFTGGLIITGVLSYNLLQRNARAEVIQKAGIMMEAALSMRGYTVKQVKPLLEMQLRRAFLPQSVPAYAATEVFDALHAQYANYTYKEATLNPTNPRDRATDWEADIIAEFQQNPEQREIVGERETATGRMLYLARPIQIKNQGCLTCHGTVDTAPQTMLKLYGTANGFGWQHGEVVGAQMVAIPMSVPMQNAWHAFYTFMGSMFGVFLLAFVVLNLMLNSIIVKPLTRMAMAADEISMGNLEMPELSVKGNDEVALLAQSFNRLRRSLEKAMNLIAD